MPHGCQLTQGLQSKLEGLLGRSEKYEMDLYYNTNALLLKYQKDLMIKKGVSLLNNHKNISLVK